MSKDKEIKVYDITLKYLTEEELDVIKRIQDGAELTGEDIAKETIEAWIHQCLAERIISN